MTRRQPRDLFTVFPAHAGVILPEFSLFFAYLGIPRTRGGDPDVKAGTPTVKLYSPHTRG